MKVGILFESDIYMYGVEEYLKASRNIRFNIRSFQFSDMEDVKRAERFYKVFTSFQILFVDFKTYCMITHHFKNNPDVLTNFNGKVVFLRLDNNYPIFSYEDVVPLRFDMAKLPISKVILPSISRDSFHRLMLRLVTAYTLDNMSQSDLLEII